MNVSQMRNIVVLKELPSNIVEEAIIILKNQSNIKKKEIIESTSNFKKIESEESGGYELAVKEAECIVEDYLKKLENSKKVQKSVRAIKNKYRKLQIISILLTVIAVAGIIMNSIG